MGCWFSSACVGLGRTCLVGLAVLAVGTLASPTGGEAARDAGPRIGPETPATPHALQVAHNSPQLAVDPTDDDVMVVASRQDAPDFGCGLQVSTDGGRGWVPVDPVAELPAGAQKCYGPQVAFDADGTLYYLFVGLHGRGNRPMGVFLTTSDDGGRTFTEPRKVLGPRRFHVRLAIDGTLGDAGRLHLVWLRPTSDPPVGGMPAPPNPIMAAHSDDEGRTWSEPIQVSDTDRQRVVAPAVAVGADHSVHVAYYDLEGDARDYRGQEGPVWDGTWSIVSATSHDGGASFEEGVVVDDALKPAERVMLIFTMPPPALTADQAGRVAVGWDDARYGDRDVFVARSADGGASWNGPVRANDDPAGNGAAQHLPQLAFAPTGRLDAIFYDRRHDPANRHVHLTYTHSTDGAAFAVNTRVTNQSTDSTNGRTYPIPSAEGQAEFGSRLGLFARDHGVLAAWTDTRNARTTPQQAIFTAPITLPAAAGHAGLWPAGLIGLAAIVTAAAVLVVVVWRSPSLVNTAIRGAAAAWRHAVEAAGRVPTGLRWTAMAGGVVAVAAVMWAPPTPARPSPTTLETTVSDGTLTVEPDTVPPGRVVVRARHAGQEAHQVVVLPLPEDMDASLHEALNSTTRRAMTVLADLPAREPGKETVFAVDLPPGRYGLVCFQKGADDESHAANGENAEFTVRRR